MKNQKGFGSVGVVVVIAFIAVVGGGMYFVQKLNVDDMPKQESVDAIDGIEESVETTGSNQQDTAEEVSDDWATYRNEKYGFVVETPREFVDKDYGAISLGGVGLGLPALDSPGYIWDSLRVIISDSEYKGDFPSSPFCREGKETVAEVLGEVREACYLSGNHEDMAELGVYIETEERAAYLRCPLVGREIKIVGETCKRMMRSFQFIEPSVPLVDVWLKDCLDGVQQTYDYSKPTCENVSEQQCNKWQNTREEKLKLGKQECNALYGGPVPSGITVLSPRPRDLIDLPRSVFNQPIFVRGFINGEGWFGNEEEAGTVQIFDENDKPLSVITILPAITNWLRLPVYFSAKVEYSREANAQGTNTGYLLFKSTATKNNDVISILKVPVEFK